MEDRTAAIARGQFDRCDFLALLGAGALTLLSPDHAARAAVGPDASLSLIFGRPAASSPSAGK